MEYIEDAKEEPETAAASSARCTTRGPRPSASCAGARPAFVILTKYPVQPRAPVVLPLRHVGDLEDLTAEELAEIHALLQRSVRALREASAPHGFNVGMNLGRVAGAGIPDHLHWHVVPRWSGDTNFMPVVGETRVLPSSCRRRTTAAAALRRMSERSRSRSTAAGCGSRSRATGPASSLIHPGLWDSRTWDDQWEPFSRRAPRRALRRTRLRTVEPPDGRAVLARPRPRGA